MVVSPASQIQSGETFSEGFLTDFDESELVEASSSLGNVWPHSYLTMEEFATLDCAVCRALFAIVNNRDALSTFGRSCDELCRSSSSDIVRSVRSDWYASLVERSLSSPESVRSTILFGSANFLPPFDFLETISTSCSEKICWLEQSDYQ